VAQELLSIMINLDRKAPIFCFLSAHLHAKLVKSAEALNAFNKAQKQMHSPNHSGNAVKADSGFLRFSTISTCHLHSL
jgi:hypothetical protein